MATNGKTKKLTVILKPKTNADSVPATTTSTSILDEFVSAVYACSGPSLVPTVAAKYSFEELYNAVINNTVQKQGQGLYVLLQDKCQRQAARLITLAASVTSDPRTFLATLQSLWNDYTSQTALLRAVFSYIDSSMASFSSGAVVSVTDMCLHAFADALVASTGAVHGVLQRTVVAVRDIVCAERDGDNVDRSMIAAIVRMLSSLGTSNRSSGLYSSHLEPVLLENCETYYAHEAAARLASLDTAQYLAHVDTRLRQEQERCYSCLLPQTWRALQPLLSKVLIAQHAGAIVERGFVPLLQSSRLSDLSLMYSLLSSVHRTEDMRKVYGDHCKAAALAITGGGAADADGELEGDKMLVQSLLDFRASQEGIIAQAFAGQESFTLALKAAVEAAANVREGKPAELIAKYLDQKLRSGGKAGADAAGSTSVSADSFESLLDRVMALFRLVHSKDIFEAFYKKDLAKRLLLGKSSSMDSEKSMVSRLKTECGSAFTSKLEGMFKDTDLSAELMAQYQAQLLGASGPKPLDTTVHVLTASYWPSYPTEPVVLPTEITQACASFERFYTQKYNGNRKIAWVPSLGLCILKAAFPGGPHPRKELEVSLYQALVLLLFNKDTGTQEAVETVGGDSGQHRTGGPLLFTQIKQMTGIPDAQLRSTLQSLALGRERVLRKEPKGRDVLDSDVFAWNEGYTSPLVRVKINQIQMKETKQEADTTTERVMQDRQYQLDAAIVRVMKARKTLGHAQLMSELLGQLRFQAKPADIKKRIESLIDREYLERGDATEGSAAVYHYLA